MNKNRLASLILSGLLFGAPVLAADPVQWEYRVRSEEYLLRVGREAEPELRNKYEWLARGLTLEGRDGWELVTTKVENTASVYQSVYIFKRLAQKPVSKEPL